jgi:hypothetical protein
MSFSPRSRRHILAAGLCLLIACVAAVASVSSLSLAPPGIAPRGLQVAGGSAHVVVDLPRPLIGDGGAQIEAVRTLWSRSVLLANLLTSEAVLDRVGRRAGIDPRQIGGSTYITANVPTVMTEPDSERRADVIASQSLPYRIEVQPSGTLPTFNVYTRAPSVPEAERLAAAAAPALGDYLRGLARQRGASPATQVHLETVGAVHGGLIGHGRKFIAGIAFLLALALSSIGVAAASRLLRRGSAVASPAPVEPPAAPRRRAGAARRWSLPSLGSGMGLPAGMTAAAATAPAPSISLPVRRPPVAGELRGSHAWRSTSRLAAQAGDWPRTTRLLPWMLAGVMTVVWLVPFNSIQLQASLPVDLKLDRLILPFVVGLWALTIAAGRGGAPRIRFTWIHAALGACVVIACLSLIVDAGTITKALELQTGVKKLTLLVSYVVLFVVVASTVRPTEVHAFIRYTLLLAVICAIGTLVEYRFHYNVFYSVPQKLLPGIFQVTDNAESAAFDDLGRRLVRGPGEIPLECVAMMAMALPIALVGGLEASTTRSRVLNGLAAVLLVAAMVSTFRKSAFMAPVSVILTLAWYRRRELLRLAPLGLVLLVGIHVLSPGAFGSIAVQLRGDQALSVNTVSDRTSDYDAIRPDVWSHVVIGRGYGTYEHTSYRILDMELLQQLVEVGVLGLAAYLLTIVAVLAVAHEPIRDRRSRDGPVALAVAAATVAFLVVSTLFDVMSFPHCPYIFLWLAALLAVTVVHRRDEEKERLEWSS